MTRIKMPSDPSRKRLIHAVQQDYRRVQKALAEPLAALPNLEMRKVNVAQNVMRDCLSAVMVEMLPYSHITPIELAKRLASYALSAVPLEDQDAVVAAFLSGFADYHMERTAAGTVISTTWAMDDGKERPNFPEVR